MGRWAQRQLGTSPQPPSLLQMINATFPVGQDVVVTYNGDILFTDFLPTDWESEGSGLGSVNAAQLASNSLTITFIGDISADFAIQYAGTNPHVLTPQFLAYT